MKIALVNCPPYNNFDQTIPVGLACVGAYLRKKGHDVFIFDYNKEFFDKTEKNINFLFQQFYVEKWWFTSKFLKIKPLLKKFYEEKVDEILRTDAKIIGFSVFNFQIKSSLFLAEMIKKRDKSRIIVFGGPGCLYYGRKILKNRNVDAVVIGEGELTMNELVESVASRNKLKLIPGLMVRKKNRIIFDDSRQPIKNLDDLPFLCESGLPFNEYKLDNRVIYTIVSSRGCPFNCCFCNTKNLWKNYRCRSAESIFQEIKYVNEKYGIEDFQFADNLINGNISELSDLCDLIIRSNIKIKMYGQGVARNEMNKKLLIKMHRAGWRLLSFGIESGSQKVLDDMNKKIKIDTVEKILHDAHGTGIKTIVAIIIGFPTERNIDFLKTVSFLIKNRKNIHGVGLSPFVIYPYTDIHTNFDKYGIDKCTLPKLYWDIGLWKTKNSSNTLFIRSIRFFAIYTILSFFGIKIYSPKILNYMLFLKS
jgi:radical SAM superfamily enzyme YgiQ (UPF0313 family)